MGLTSCAECQYIFIDVIGKLYCRKTGQRIHSLDKVPSWCPLKEEEDFNEKRDSNEKCSVNRVYSVRTTDYFAAAHRLHLLDKEHKCRNLHGHTYKVELQVAAEEMPDGTDMLIDFGVLKQILSSVLENLDHAVLVSETDKELLDVCKTKGWKMCLIPGTQTTSENIARYIAKYVSQALWDEGTLVRSKSPIYLTVRVYESEKSSASYSVELKK